MCKGRTPGFLEFTRGMLGAVGARLKLKLLVQSNQGLDIQCHGSAFRLRPLLTYHGRGCHIFLRDCSCPQRRRADLGLQREKNVHAQILIVNGGSMHVFECVGKEESHGCDAPRGS